MPREAHQPDRTIELALFHHFSTVTYKTLREDERSDHHLQVVIPRLALSHDYLLDTVLALSALHTESLDVCITRYWLHIALDYQHRALLAFNKALANITSRNCEAIAVCSMLMIILVLAIPGVSQDESPPDPASEILGLRNLLQGISHILCQSEETLRKGELGPWFQPIFEPKPKVSRESQLTSIDSLDCDQSVVNEQIFLYSN
jgi:gamma-glutamyltranspeptidase/glutathione hydrolase